MIPEEPKSKYPNVWKVAQKLTRCKHPEKVLNALAAITVQEARETFPERFIGKTDQEIINEIAAVVRRG